MQGEEQMDRLFCDEGETEMTHKREIFRYKGERNSEYTANAYVLKCIRVAMLVYITTWILDITGVFIVDLRIMNTGLFFAVGTWVLSCLYARYVGIDKPRDKYYIMTFLVMMATEMYAMLSYHAVLFTLFPLICSTQYFSKRFTFFTFTMTCIGYAVAVFAGFRFGLCDANMLLLTYTNTAFYESVLPKGQFELNNNGFLIFLFFIFPRWLIIWIMLLLQNHLTREIQSRAAREAKTRHMAETDGLTGLFNRTKFYQMKDTYYKNCPLVGVVFCDVNNLKIMNDTKGHEYGDELLCGLSRELQNTQDERTRAYRLGGDEFILVRELREGEDFDSTAMELELKLDRRKLSEEVILSVAVGFSSGKGEDMDGIIREADDRMYLRKQEMKRVQ